MISPGRKGQQTNLLFNIVVQAFTHGSRQTRMKDPLPRLDATVNAIRPTRSGDHRKRTSTGPSLRRRGQTHQPADKQCSHTSAASMRPLKVSRRLKEIASSVQKAVRSAWCTAILCRTGATRVTAHPVAVADFEVLLALMPWTGEPRGKRGRSAEL